MKTLAIRLEDEQHARLAILAKLSDLSLTDAIRAAIDAYIALLAANSEVSAKAQSVLDEIEREASEQRAAIASLFGDSTTTSPAPSRTSPRTKA